VDKSLLLGKMNDVIYSKLAEFICFMCHGMCCNRGTMQFRWIGYKLKFTGWEAERCVSYNPITGRCKVYGRKEKPRLCRLYKCGLLNLISKMFKQKIWDGTWFENEKLYIH